MKRLAVALLVGAALLVSGCASSPDRADADKAAEVNAKLGLRYMMQGNNERAMEKLKHALTFDRHYGPAHHYLAELYRRLERPEEAGEHYRQAVRAMPDDSSLRNNYGAFLCSSGRIDEAERQFLAVLEDPVYPQRGGAYENLGLCLMRGSESARAEGYLREALELDPRRPKALFAMAQISYEKEQYLSARAYLQRYREVARHTAETLWLAIRVERVLGDRDAVASHSMLLKNRFPQSEQARQLAESEQR